jgi:hypothetical protein
MHIANDGEYSQTNPRFGRYDGVTFRGRDREALDNEVPQKRGAVDHWPREALHVWNLVAAMLRAMGYVDQSGNTVLSCQHGGDALNEVLLAPEDSEEHAGQLAAQLDAYRVLYGELPA